MKRGSRRGEEEKWKKSKVKKETENIIALLLYYPHI
jgi:hypothetical protein